MVMGFGPGAMVDLVNRAVVIGGLEHWGFGKEGFEALNDARQRVPASPEAHAAAELGQFVRTNWPFGPPYPRLYYDIRATRPGPPYCSLHAKCVTVDGLQAFISSANFTQRGQDRNIEAGVLIQDPTFAQHLARQWHGLIESGAVAEYRVE